MLLLQFGPGDLLNIHFPSFNYNSCTDFIIIIIIIISDI